MQKETKRARSRERGRQKQTERERERESVRQLGRQSKLAINFDSSVFWNCLSN